MWGGIDAFLASRLTAGDELALAEAFDRFGRAVYGAALRVVRDGASAAEMCVQDVFVELWSHPERYDPAAGPLRTYLIVLARHRAVDLVRSELRRMARQERHHRLTPGQPTRGARRPGAGRRHGRRDKGRGADAARRAAAVVELAYFEGLTCREVALAAGIPEGTAKSRLRLAMAKLETMLDRQLLEWS